MLPIRNYPRPGHRIAPSVLRPILEGDRLPEWAIAAESHVETLADLDERSWERYGKERCVELARAVVDRVRRELPPRRLSALSTLRIPEARSDLCRDNLELEQRTHTCLLRLEREEGKILQDIAGWPITRLFALWGFGAKCLVDLLTSLEAANVSIRPDETGKLEAELYGLTRDAGTAKNRRRAVRRFGFDGRGTRTLREVADEEGCTWQNIDLICKRVERGLREYPPSELPCLARALESVRGALPQTTRALTLALRDSGIAAEPFAVEGLLAACRLLQRPPPFQVQEVSDGLSVAIAPGQDELCGLFVHAAWSLVSRYGVVDTQHVSEKFSARHSTAIPADLATRLLECKVQALWLDARKEWFWTPVMSTGRMPLCLTKALAVARRLSPDKLRQAVLRPYRRTDVGTRVPPAEILVSLCQQMGCAQFDGSCLIAETSLDWRAVLRAAEATLAGIFGENGFVMRRADLLEACAGRGMSLHTAEATIDYSPIIERVQPCVYALLGHAAATQQ
ncbi:MAG: hypothetical protein V2A73_22420 [Pseudomonadota bacterium]